MYRYLQYLLFNATKFYKNSRYLATTKPLSHTASARSRNFFTGSGKKVRLQLHNTATEFRILEETIYPAKHLLYQPSIVWPIRIPFHFDSDPALDPAKGKKKDLGQIKSSNSYCTVEEANFGHISQKNAN